MSLNTPKLCFRRCRQVKRGFLKGFVLPTPVFFPPSAYDVYSSNYSPFLLKTSHSVTSSIAGSRQCQLHESSRFYTRSHNSQLSYWVLKSDITCSAFWNCHHSKCVACCQETSLLFEYLYDYRACFVLLNKTCDAHRSSPVL